MKLLQVKNFWLGMILLVAVILRLWKLDVIPPHLTPDEAALGYNAFSILKTGRDEYGEFLPIIFKSFGDYKPGLYVYLTVPSVAILGLNEFAVRLPSALAGVMAVWLVYKVILGLGGVGKLGRESRQGLTALVGAFLLAISPWHIHFSRGAWEANVSLTLTLAGVYYFLRSLNKPKFLILSSLFFSLTLITYQGAKLSTAIVLLVLVVTFGKKLKSLISNNFVTVIQSTITGFIVVLPILFSFYQGQTGRLNVFSVFSYPRPEKYLQDFLDQGNEKVVDLSYYLFHSEKLNFSRGILGRWFNHYSGRFLFFEGDYQNPRHSAPNQGMLLLGDLLILPLGLFALVKFRSKLSKFVLLWLVFSPLPAALSRDQVHAVRSLNMIVPLTLISSYGLVYLFKIIRDSSSKLLRVTSYGFLFILFLGSFIYFIDSYFVHLPKHHSQLWEYGNKQVVQIVTPIQGNYETVKIQQSFSQPYIYFLFYGAAADTQKYDPAKYQKQAKLVESEFKGDVGYIDRLDNICFCAIDWARDKKEHGTLVIADNIRIPETELRSDSVNLINEIKYLNGETAFRIVEVK